MAREWLVTNGLGSYASGTISGVRSRRYHGLLVAALAPPLGRTVLVGKFHETADGEPMDADTWSGRRYADEPASLVGFELDGSVPSWTYEVGTATLIKRIWMEPGADTTYVTYEHAAGDQPVLLEAKAMVTYRDFHQTTRAGDWHMHIEPTDSGLSVTPFDGAAPILLLSSDAQMTPTHEWYRDYFLGVEAFRGLDDLDDLLHAATITAILEPGTNVTVVATTDAQAGLDGQRALARRTAYDQGLMTDGEIASRLTLAADQFLVARQTGGDVERTVIAGYHWFGDWGRDTMIALPGLTLTTGRADEGEKILRTYSRFVDKGMLPNRFTGDGELPEFNTIDATLWYFEAIRAHHTATGDDALLGDLFPVLAEIIDWHLEGTRFGIGVDPADGLLAGGEQGIQLTWMDAKVGDWVVTPRIGKPVEINALWYNALLTMAGFAGILGLDPSEYLAAADRAHQSFDRFWNPERGYLFDVIDGPDGNDPALRPNQLFAVSLPASPLDRARQKAIVDMCAAELLTPFGLRTLGTREPGYEGYYGGSVRQRDAAYHQGTVWPWLIGPFATAHLRVYQDPRAVRDMLRPLLAHLLENGSVTECADGDPPHTPRAAIAQAWSIAEVARIWNMIGDR